MKATPNAPGSFPLALLLALVACGPAAGAARAAPPGGTPPPGARPPLPAASPDRRTPLVGGCAHECRDPAAAVAGFLAATARPGAPDAAAPFVDSTRLVLDGRPLGARWAELWRDLKSATRKDEIRQALGELSSWTVGLTPGQVRDALTAGPRTVRSWSTEAEYEFQPPGAAPWTIVLAPRGIEWLVIEVRRTLQDAPEREVPR